MRKYLLRTVSAIAATFLAVNAASAGITCSVPFTFTAGTAAVASQVNANFAALVSCFTQSANDGVNTDINQLAGLTTRITPTQGGSTIFVGGTTAGAANAQTLATTAPTFSAVANYRVTFVAGFTNTTALTLNVNSTGAFDVYRKTQLGATITVGGEVVAGNPYTAVFDGSKYILDGETIQVGKIEYMGGSAAGPGRLLANGAAVSRTKYADLFTVYGTTYGSGDGVTTFNLPNISGRVPVMADSGGLISTACSGSSTRGTTCGAQNQTIAKANLPNYTLTSSGGSATLKVDVLIQSGANNGSTPGGGSEQIPSSNTYGTSQGTLQTTFVAPSVSLGGSGTALTTLPPTLIVNAQIVY